MNDPRAVRAWVRRRQDPLVDELMQWVRIPSVVGPAKHRIDVVRSAGWLAGTPRATGTRRTRGCASTC